MAAPRSALPMVLAGTLLFGVLTFLLGLLVGVNVAPPVAKTAAPAATSAAAPTPAAPASPAAAQADAPASAAPASPAASAAPAQGGSSAGGGTAPSSAPAPAKSGAAEPAPAIKPVKVKGLGYGTPPSVTPSSALRGKLVQQAAAPAADGAADAAKDAPKEASKDAGPALVYSVSLGRFLVEENAGRLYAKAQEKGLQPVVVVADPPDPAGWLTVTLGPQPDPTAAGRLASDAAALGFETWLVTWLAQ